MYVLEVSIVLTTKFVKVCKKSSVENVKSEHDIVRSQERAVRGMFPSASPSLLSNFPRRKCYPDNLALSNCFPGATIAAAVVASSNVILRSPSREGRRRIRNQVGESKILRPPEMDLE